MTCTTLFYHALVNLPLVLVSLYFPFLWPLPIASLGISCGLCVLAGIQAKLPRGKRRSWSHPLIALLFFLQPIVRGWSRLKVRLNLQLIPGGNPVPLDTALDLTQAPQTMTFWSDGTVDRCHFLRHVQEKIHAQNWPLRVDTGWVAHDLEVLGSPWGRLRVTTATEELDQGRKNIQCRLESVWSAGARLLFGVIAIAIAALIGLFASDVPWVWMSLVVLPVLGWFLEEERLGLQCAAARLLEQTAAENGLVKLEVTKGSVVARSIDPSVNQCVGVERGTG
jgi:hypothetical protein